MIEKEKEEKKESYTSPEVIRREVEAENSFADSTKETVGGSTSIHEDWGSDDTSIGGDMNL
jgi:hypothetical protein